MAARRAAADRAALGRLARSDAAFMCPPQCGQRSGPVASLWVAGVGSFMRLLSFGPGERGDVFGGAENGFELAENHDDQAGRMALEQVGDDVAGDLF